MMRLFSTVILMILAGPVMAVSVAGSHGITGNACVEVVTPSSSQVSWVTMTNCSAGMASCPAVTINQSSKLFLCEDSSSASNFCQNGLPVKASLVVYQKNALYCMSASVYKSDLVVSGAGKYIATISRDAYDSCQISLAPAPAGDTCPLQ